jgi:hypothetical protein
MDVVIGRLGSLRAARSRAALAAIAVATAFFLGGVPTARAQPLLTPDQRDSLLRDMTPEQRQRLWQLLTPEQKGDFLRNLTPEQRAGLAAQMTPEQRERLRERLRDDRERRDIDGSMRGRLSADERHRLREQIIEAQRERREALHRHGGRFDRPPERADK